MNESKFPFFCPHCSEIYLAPKLVPCGHVYCNDCAKDILTEKNAVWRFKCQVCDFESDYADQLAFEAQLEEPKALTVILRDLKAFIVKGKKEALGEWCFDFQECGHRGSHYCENCKLYFCDDCLERLHSSKIVVKHVVIDAGLKKKLPVCEKHSLEMELYCGKCKHLICDKCGLLDHSKHQLSTIEEAASLMREELAIRKAPLDKYLSSSEQKIDGLKDQEKILQRKLSKIKSSMESIQNDTFKAKETGKNIDALLNFFNSVDLVDKGASRKILETIEKLVTSYDFMESSDSETSSDPVTYTISIQKQTSPKKQSASVNAYARRSDSTSMDTEIVAEILRKPPKTSRFVQREPKLEPILSGGTENDKLVSMRPGPNEPPRYRSNFERTSDPISDNSPNKASPLTESKKKIQSIQRAHSERRFTYQDEGPLGRWNPDESLHASKKRQKSKFKKSKKQKKSHNKSSDKNSGSKSKGSKR